MTGKPQDLYTYYQCIRADYYVPKFYCRPYSHDLPPTKDCFESSIIPVPQACPLSKHSSLLERHLRDKISVQLLSTLPKQE